MQISPMELDFLWEDLGAGEPPYPFDIRSHGATLDERAKLRRQVYASPPDPRVRDWLAVLAGPGQSVDSVFRPELGAEPVRALAACSSDGGPAVLAVQNGDGLTLRPIERGGLVSAIVDLLPPAPRGTEPSVSLPSEEFGRVSGPPNLRGGQIAANCRDRLGGRRRSPVLAWFDNQTGRYLGQIRPAPDGTPWTTIFPADAPAMRRRITEMMTSVTGPDR